MKRRWVPMLLAASMLLGASAAWAEEAPADAPKREVAANGLVKRGLREDYIPRKETLVRTLDGGFAFFLGNEHYIAGGQRREFSGAAPRTVGWTTVIEEESARELFGADTGVLEKLEGGVGLRAAAEQQGYSVGWDESGLITVTPASLAFDRSVEADRFLQDEILKWIIYEKPSETQLVEDLKKNSGHPRLLATADTFDAIRRNMKTDATVAKMVEDVRLQTENFMEEPPLEWAIPDGRRMVVEKDIKVRLKNLCLLYQLTGEERYAQRAWKELEKGAAFPDWNDSREFLNTAGMMEGFSIAYDWLYDWMNEAQRKTVRDAIVEKGMKPGLAQQETPAWWMFSYPFVSNWTAVCNGGLTLAALAVGDETDPQLTGKVLRGAMGAVEDSLLMEYAPDGGWGEGPGYWNYTFSYLTLMLSGMDSALGTTYGLMDTPGLHETAYFPVNLVGPQGAFNYGDSGVGTVNSPEQFFYGRTYGDADLTGIRLAIMTGKKTKASVEDVIWFAPETCNNAFLTSMETLPKDSYYRGPEVGLMRSGRDDAGSANFMGFKGGSPWGSHRHMDAGNFVLDALGQRWAHDLGSDSYSLDGYFNYDEERFHYYRMGGMGHNILIFDGEELPQELGAASTMEQFVSKPKGAYGILDLAPSYPKHVNALRRGFLLGDWRSSFTVQDEISAKAPVPVVWQMHTKAEIELRPDGKSAVLTQGGKQLYVAVDVQGGVPFKLSVADAAPAKDAPSAAEQDQNVGVKKLLISFENVTDLRYAVHFLPVDADGVLPQVPAFVPLDEWSVPDGEVTVPRLEEITLDGKPLEGFSPETYQYTVTLPAEATSAPQIQASGNQDVSVRPAASLPGRAVVTAVNRENPALRTNYYLQFKKLPRDMDLSKLAAMDVKETLVSAEPQKENPGAALTDGDLNTRWSAEGAQWARLDLGEAKQLDAVGIAFHQGDVRVSYFTIEVSLDGESWQTVYEGESGGQSAAEELLPVDPVQARYVRITGAGNSVNTWNSYSEVKLYTLEQQAQNGPLN